MKPGKVDIEFTRGDYYPLRLSFVDSQTTPQPLDVSDKTFTAQIRRTPDDAILVQFDINGADRNAGLLLLSLEAAATGALSGSYVWDLQMVDGAAKPVTWLAGTVYVKRDVTRS